MQSMLQRFYTKPLVLYLAAALLLVSTAAGPAEAMLLPAADAPAFSVDRAADLQKIQTALESKTVQQKLVDYGLSPDEALAKVNTLSDAQVHQLAANLDSVQAGGDAGSIIVGLAIIALLVVVLIYLLEGRIEIKNK